MMTTPSPVAQELANRIHAQSPFMAWAAEHHFVGPGKQLDFQDHPYLPGIYACDDLDIVLKKSAQTGGSEYSIAQALWHAGGPAPKQERTKVNGWSVIYVLTTMRLVTRFVQTRIDPVVQRSKEYKALLGQTRVRGKGTADSTTLKKFGDGHIIFTGSNPSGGFISDPADMVVIDELDRCEQANIPEAWRRMEHSPWQYRRRLSTPTVSNYGIDKAFAESDAREWLVRCGHCNAWQQITWTGHVVVEEGGGEFSIRDRWWKPGDSRDLYAVCENCGGAVDRLGRNGNEWVAKHPGRKAKGFHFCKLGSPGLVDGLPTLLGLVDRFREAQKDTRALEVMWQSDLAEAYDAPGARITDELIDGCTLGYSMPGEHHGPCIAGIDIGGHHNMVIAYPNGPRLDVLWAGTTTSLDEALPIMRRHNVGLVVIDIMPETHGVNKFQEDLWDLLEVWACRYQSTPGRPLPEPKMDWSYRIITAERTDSIDNMVGKLRGKTLAFPRDIRAVAGFADELKTPARRLREDNRGYEWTKGQDHYFHALNYAIVALHLRDHHGCGVSGGGSGEWKLR